MNFIKTYRLFFSSVLFGIFVWLSSFLIIPAQGIESVKPKTILFIVSSYFSLVFGFSLLKFKTSEKQIAVNTNSFFKYLCLFIVFCFVLRWIDLFVLREISISNGSITNRNRINIYNHRSNVFFVLASIFKSLYFFPFIIILKNKYRINFYTIIAIALLFFPLVEASMLGNRKPFFEVFLIVFISIVFYRRPKINIRNISVFLVSIFALLTISFVILLNREQNRDDTVTDVYKTIVTGKYNDILKPREEVLSFLKDTSVASIKKNYTLILLQSGQYINHGFFEFNHIINNQDLATTNGSYVFYPFVKFFNRIGLVKSNNNINPSPRKIVYLTAFGSFYIDFRWFTLVVFFLLGLFQRYIYDKSTSSLIHSPLLIYLAIINVFLPILNYMRGAGIYPLIGFVFLLSTHYYYLKRTNEKSINT